MNKFRRFLDKISAETCLKRIILLVNHKNLPSAGGSAPKLPFSLNDYKMCKTLLPFKLLVDLYAW